MAGAVTGGRIPGDPEDPAGSTGPGGVAKAVPPGPATGAHRLPRALVSHGLRWSAVLFVVCVVVFAVTSLLPGDAATAVAGAQADPERLARLRAEAGLDRPAWQRFADWLGGLARGDLGQSLVDGRPVGALLRDRLAASLLIAVPSWVLALLLGTTAAVLIAQAPAARRSRAGAAVAAAAAAVPDTALVVLLVMLLSVALGWLPAVSLVPVGGSGWDRPEILLLPVIALTLPAAAWTTRMLMGPAADIFRRRFVRDALLRGVPPARCVRRHVLPHLAAPLGQAAAVLAGALLAGTAVVESLLGYPGLGQQLATSVAARDVPVVQGTALLLAAVVLTAVTGADALAARAARRAGAAR
ncbi:ABC transporter permease [Streptomyces sp. ACA25]|uniref:ABC transporter permease n=1 Tax=Streptomyces sp. ACA25 TaxID=3022596 RepID=UPI0023081336|nr:ABC transporter permease [Streptomyces sp. ACA25]MDB1087490.1 ABC transporter permease [Streptomyces sp. ACA25]